MKFYVDVNDYDDYWSKIRVNKLTAIYLNYWAIRFYKNGMRHNIKKAAVYYSDGFECFYLNGIYYGDQTKFTNHSWRRLVKMEVFK